MIHSAKISFPKVRHYIPPHRRPFTPAIQFLFCASRYLAIATITLIMFSEITSWCTYIVIKITNGNSGMSPLAPTTKQVSTCAVSTTRTRLRYSIIKYCGIALIATNFLSVFFQTCISGKPMVMWIPLWMLTNDEYPVTMGIKTLAVWGNRKTIAWLIWSWFTILTTISYTCTVLATILLYRMYS